MGKYLSVTFLALTLVLGLSGAPAFSQELIYSDAPTASCLEAGQTTDELSACIGLSSSACMEDTVGGFSTVGMGGCLSRELDYWDGRINAAYRELMAKMKRHDAENASYGTSGISNMADALRAMQRAWIPFRDASCDFERSKFSNGTGAGPAQISCLMQMTADQTLLLLSAGIEQ